MLVLISQITPSWCFYAGS